MHNQFEFHIITTSNSEFYVLFSNFEIHYVLLCYRDLVIFTPINHDLYYTKL